MRRGVSPGRRGGTADQDKTCAQAGIDAIKDALNSDVRSITELTFDPGQRRTMSRVGPPPHAARLWREPGALDLAIVAEFPPDFSFRQKLSGGAADPLCGVPEIMAAPTRKPWFEIVEHADAPTTQRARQSQPFAHDPTVCPNQRHSHGATGQQLQIERLDLSRIMRSQG